ncbi:MAG: DUF1573 domain-containing protein [Candidatus Omnitrophota bacterium]
MRRVFKILSLFLAFFLLSASFVLAKPKALVSHTLYDLGRISDNKIYERTFTIDNIGDELLKFRVDVGCGCVKIISPEAKKEIIVNPGEQAIVKFKFDPTGYSGEIKKSIYIETNDPILKTINLPVRAFVILTPKNVLQRFLMFRPGVVMLSGLSDGINPCAFTVLVFFISFLSLVGYEKKQAIIIGLSFIFAIFLTYILIGFGIFEFVRRLSIFEPIAKIVNLVIACLSLGLGILSIYDFWIYRKTKDVNKILLQLPGVVKQKIHETIRSTIDVRKKNKDEKHVFRLILSAFICGVLVSLFESVCTGQLYLPTIAYIFKTTTFKLKALGFLLLYNLMFILPLLIIFRLGIVGMTSADFADVAKRHLSGVKLAMGIMFLLLGITLIVIKG